MKSRVSVSFVCSFIFYYFIAFLMPHLLAPTLGYAQSGSDILIGNKAISTLSTGALAKQFPALYRYLQLRKALSNTNGDKLVEHVVSAATNTNLKVQIEASEFLGIIIWDSPTAMDFLLRQLENPDAREISIEVIESAVNTTTTQERTNLLKNLSSGSRSEFSFRIADMLLQWFQLQSPSQTVNSGKVKKTGNYLIKNNKVIRATWSLVRVLNDLLTLTPEAASEQTVRSLLEYYKFVDDLITTFDKGSPLFEESKPVYKKAFIRSRYEVLDLLKNMEKAHPEFLNVMMNDSGFIDRLINIKLFEVDAADMRSSLVARKEVSQYSQYAESAMEERLRCLKRIYEKADPTLKESIKTGVIDIAKGYSPTVASMDAIRVLGLNGPKVDTILRTTILQSMCGDSLRLAALKAFGEVADFSNPKNEALLERLLNPKTLSAEDIKLFGKQIRIIAERRAHSNRDAMNQEMPTEEMFLEAAGEAQNILNAVPSAQLYDTRFLPEELKERWSEWERMPERTEIEMRAKRLTFESLRDRLLEITQREVLSEGARD